MRPPTFCATPDSWFDVRPMAEGVYLVAEPGHVNCYLVVGTESALLFDTGLGIAPISSVVASLTDLPVLVVSSHHHLDHRGGNADLATTDLPVTDFAVHPHVIEPHSPCAHVDADPAFLSAYAEAMTEVAREYRRYSALDRRYFFALNRLPAMRPLPQLSGWTVPGVPPTRTLDDGEVLDLGGRHLRVLHTPGHSPDELCLFEDATGFLFSGDTVLGAAHWLHGDGADVAAFARSTARLSRLPVTRVFAAHNLTPELPASSVTDVATAAAAVRDSATAPESGRDLLGHPVVRHDCGPVTILTPAPTPAHLDVTRQTTLIERIRP
ncbi:Glyoxylase, beta-lactamase superfamily II [Rhodococcus triatomae]|uniref:Glyoxylase, beta-lactamase superfamily II n=1 Tax=Rhodococcus triatomae TaxID=300028 RepID=A0A1G8L4B0_9NOCA|nr:MBL fold metallo-hydrolase [Rhodococcus triatomae]SDI50508.1 Glyoxylase, beta-lactamase superfamily II [Rhodococcus triatomae]